MSAICDWCMVQCNPFQGTTVDLTQNYGHESRMQKIAACKNDDLVASTCEILLNIWRFSPQTDELNLIHSIGLGRFELTQIRFALEGRILVGLCAIAGVIKLFDTQLGREIKGEKAIRRDYFDTFEIFEDKIILATTTRRELRFFTLNHPNNPEITDGLTIGDDGRLRADVVCIDYMRAGREHCYIMGHKTGTISVWKSEQRGDHLESTDGDHGRFQILPMLYRSFQPPHYPQEISQVHVLDASDEDVFVVVQVEATASCYFMQLTTNEKNTFNVVVPAKSDNFTFSHGRSSIGLRLEDFNNLPLDSDGVPLKTKVENWRRLEAGLFLTEIEAADVSLIPSEKAEALLASFRKDSTVKVKKDQDDSGIQCGDRQCWECDDEDEEKYIRLTFSHSIIEVLEPRGMCRSMAVDNARRFIMIGTSDGKVVTYEYASRQVEFDRETVVSEQPNLEIMYGKSILIARGLQNCEPLMTDHHGHRKNSVFTNSDRDDTHE